MKRLIYAFLLATLLLASCSGVTTVSPTSPNTEAAPSPSITAGVADTPTVGQTVVPTENAPTASIGAQTPTQESCFTKDPTATVDQRVDLLLACMSMDEKIGQMTQVEKNSIQPGDITKYFIGSILSGGGGYPNGNNTPEGWAAMIDGFQREALNTRLGIPLIYGVDAVHGHNNLYGATIFPQEIGLGAANDPALMEKIGRASAEEMLATGVTWDFAPVIAVPQDIRWGRTYEAYGEDTNLVSQLGAAYIKGLQSIPAGVQTAPGETLHTLATPKHFLGDGGTQYGTSTQNIMLKQYLLDQGDMKFDEATVRQLFLPPYKAAVDAGAMSVMASFSSWNGVKMHAQKPMLTDVLKGELGFKGFVVSDWGGMDQIDPNDYYKSVVTSVNAGVDMSMVPYDYVKFIDAMKQAVDKGDIKPERIDDAVRRILTAKFMLGLFDHPMSNQALRSTIRSQEHLNLAREAVRKSLVLLKNDNQVLPIAKDTASIFVAGQGADDLGMQSGGWTIEWQGGTGKTIVGTSILDGIKATVSANTNVEYSQNGNFNGNADVGIVVVGEQPYAEGVGDTNDLQLTAADRAAIEHTRGYVKKLVVVIISGRPLVITDQLPIADAWVAAWLPGSEGQGVSDVLFGDFPFTGKLPYTWPRSNEQLPININNAQGKTGNDAPLFPFGYGLEK